jgi:UPF0755 protein
MKRNRLTIALWMADIALIIVLSFIYYLSLPVSTSKVLYIPHGSITKIITYLQYKKIDVSPLDGYLIRLAGMPQQGWINLGETVHSRADFLQKVMTEKAAMRDVTLIPGETTYVFLRQLASEMSLDATELERHFNAYAPVEEGALVPDTYKLPLGIGEKEAVLLLLNRSAERMRKMAEKIFGVYNETKWFQYVTMASVVQKEAADVDDMPLVSSVIHNRLKKGMRLQMDGTLNYGPYSHVKITARRIREDKSPYNTYKYKGLPPAPVCNVSFDAIKAAIFPATTDYLYFVKDKKGRHSYSRYYSTHLKNIGNVTK